MAWLRTYCSALPVAGRRRAHRPARALEPADPRLCELLDAMGWEAVTFEQLVVRTGMALAPLARLVAEPRIAGLGVPHRWVARAHGRRPWLTGPEVREYRYWHVCGYGCAVGERGERGAEHYSSPQRPPAAGPRR